MEKRRGLFLDILYVLVIAALLFVYWFLRRPVHDDLLLILGWILILIGYMVMFGPLIGKIVSAAFCCLIFFKMGELLSLWPLLIVAASIAFIILYFTGKKGRYHIKSIYRILGILLIYLAFSCHTAYKAEIDKEDDGYAINLVNTDYYDYYHFDDEEKFIEKFGKLSYLDRDIVLSINEKLNRDEYTKAIDEWLNRDEAVTENKFTGFMKNKNVIIIQANYLYECFVSEDLTPNIYKLKTEGMSFEGFNNQYTKYGTPSFEVMTNLSLYPTGEDGCVNYLYDDNHYGETLANVFKRNGYATYMYYNDYADFFNHTQMSRIFGYDDLITPYSMGLDGMQDNETMLENVAYFLGYEKKQMIYYVSQEFDEISRSDEELVRNRYPFANDDQVRMIVNLMDLDRGICKLMETVEMYENSKKVVIVLYGINDDHTQQMKHFASTMESSYDTELYIYNSAKKARTVTKYGSSLDLLPTLANLWGFKYDNSCIIGRDLLDSEYKGMQLANNPELSPFWYSKTRKYEYITGLNIERYGERADDLRQRYLFSAYWFKYGKYYLENKGE